MIQRESLLIVDDNNIARAVLVRQLTKKEGYEVVDAATGPIALTLLMKRSFHLVLLDFVMQPLTGLEVLQRIRRQHPPDQLPVLMMSGTKDPELILRATQLGANDFFFRPFQLQELLDKIRHHLDGARSLRTTGG